MHKMILHTPWQLQPFRGDGRTERGDSGGGETRALLRLLPLQSNPSKATAMRAVLQPCAGTWNLYFISQDNYRSCHGFTRISRFHTPSTPRGVQCSKASRKKRGGRSENQKLVGNNCNCAHIMHSLWTQRNMCFPNGSKGGGKQGSRRGARCGRCYANDWCHPAALKVLWLHEYSVDLWN